MRAAERLTEHTRRLPPLKTGDHVRIQNQTGSHPNKWDKTGLVIEVKQFDQYVIRVDGSGRITPRNRKFLRKYDPVQRRNPPQTIPENLLNLVQPPIIQSTPKPTPPPVPTCNPLQPTPPGPPINDTRHPTHIHPSTMIKTKTPMQQHTHPMPPKHHHLPQPNPQNYLWHYVDYKTTTKRVSLNKELLEQNMHAKNITILIF